MTLPAAEDVQPDLEKYQNELLQVLAELPPEEAPRKNVLSGYYLVDTKTPLPQFNGELSRAYAASDERDATQSLYALVCDAHIPVRGKAIKEFLGMQIPHCVTLLAAGGMDLSGIGHRYVLIYTRPRGKSLTALLRERGRPFPESFVSDSIIGPLSRALQKFHERGISHGRINPDNIFISDTATLGEWLCEPCGYGQPYMYETPSRAQAHPAGKGEGGLAHDYFAIGVLAAYLRVGQALFDKSPTPEAHVARLLHSGSYLALTRNHDFSEAITDLLRGTLNDSDSERWTWEQLSLWARGRRFNMLSPSAPMTGTRPFMIEEKQYINPRELAQGLYLHWEQARTLLRERSILRWVELSAGRRDIGEGLRKCLPAQNTAMTEAQLDEMVARCLILLDPLAPVPMRGTRAHVDGMGGLIAETHRTGNTHHGKDLNDIIEFGLPSFWADVHKKEDDKPNTNISDVLWIMERMRVMARMQEYGFGLERMLYELTPHLSCISPRLQGEYAGTAKELLIALEHIARHKKQSEPLIDRHIAAFIAAKLNISRPVGIPELSHLPKLGKTKAVTALRLFNQAYVSAGRPHLAALTIWIALDILKVVAELHSRTLRSEMQKGIVQTASSGSLQMLYDFINQRGYVDADLHGYQEAIATYRAIEDEVNSYNDKKILLVRAKTGGHAIARQVANVGLVLFMLSYIWQHWF